MSLQRPEPDGDDAGDDGVLPACRATLTGDATDDGTWQRDDPAIYPQGYPPLCQHPKCFGEIDGPRDDDGRMPEYDHADDVDALVRTTECRNTGVKRHRLADDVDPGGDDA